MTTGHTKDHVLQEKQQSKASRLMMLARRAGLDGFVMALLLSILLAYLWPGPGTYEGRWSLSALSGYGVSLIFFFYGLGLSVEKLRAGLGNWKHHMVVQLTTFLLFPLLILAGRSLLASEQTELLWLGIFFLAALPSTVSSAVVMVSMAGGNIPAAIFNASISSLLGVVLTPLWMGLLMQSAEASIDFTQVVGKLALQVLLPVVLGFLLHARLGAFATRHRSSLRYFDQSVILLIVYTSFSDSFAQGMFAPYSAADLLWLGSGLSLLFLLAYGLTSGISRLLHFGREDRVTLIFCGSKKSLVHGTVMAKVLFSGSIIGIMLLPIMVYHSLQLIAASMLAQAMARKAAQAEKTASGK